MNSSMNTRLKKIVPVLTITTMLLMTIPLQAAAESKAASQIPEKTTREYGYQSGQALPAIEERITDGEGNTYRLVSFDDPVEDPAYQRPAQYYARQIVKDIPLDGIDNLSYYFPASIYIEDGSYVGNIPLAASPYYVIDFYESFTGQVDRYHTLYNLPDNDVTRLPFYMDFVVSSDSSFGATATGTLRLLSADYEVAGTNALGLPNDYTVHLTYRGQESWLEPHHYQVTASYGGYIESTVGHYLVVGHYELVPQPAGADATPAPAVTVLLPMPEASQESPVKLSFPLVAAAIVVVLSLMWLLAWLLFFRKNAALIRQEDDRRMVVLRKRIDVVEDQAVFGIPDRIDLYDRAQYIIELKPRLANQQGMLLVTWRDCVIAREMLNASIQIDMDRLAIKAVADVVSESVINRAGLTAEI